MPSLAINVAARPTLLHQDTHLANWYALPDGSMGIADRQCVARGQWALDIAYALAIGLSIEIDAPGSATSSLSTCNGRPKKSRRHPLSRKPGWVPAADVSCRVFLGWRRFGIGEDGPVAANISLNNIQRAAQTIDDLDSFDALDAG